MASAGSGDLKTVARGLMPAGLDPSTLTPEGRDEVRAAIDAILRLWDHRNARLTLALEQLDKAAAEIDRLKKINEQTARVRCAECDCGDGPCNWIAEQ